MLVFETSSQGSEPDQFAGLNLDTPHVGSGVWHGWSVASDDMVAGKAGGGQGSPPGGGKRGGGGEREGRVLVETLTQSHP